MIDLLEHVVKLEGVDYVPLSIAQQALAEVSDVKSNIPELQQVMEELKIAVDNINLDINISDD